jgi:hypothetical protein
LLACSARSAVSIGAEKRWPAYRSLTSRNVLSSGSFPCCHVGPDRAGTANWSCSQPPGHLCGLSRPTAGCSGGFGSAARRRVAAGAVECGAASRVSRGDQGHAEADARCNRAAARPPRARPSATIGIRPRMLSCLGRLLLRRHRLHHEVVGERWPPLHGRGVVGSPERLARLHSRPVPRRSEAAVQREQESGQRGREGLPPCAAGSLMLPESQP